MNPIDDRSDAADLCETCHHPAHGGICSTDRCACGIAHAKASTLEQLAARSRALDAKLASLRRAGL
ncbi:MAG: hypothetical protein U0229_23560 [Anaeromyxobacter sp.]